MQVHGARQMSLVRQVHAAKCITIANKRKVSPGRDTFATAQRNTYLRFPPAIAAPAPPDGTSVCRS
jgi:hypothetical protein